MSPSSYPQPHLFSLYEALLVRVTQDGLNLLVDLLQAAGGELEIVLIGPTGGHYVLRGLPKYYYHYYYFHPISSSPEVCNSCLRHGELQMSVRPHEPAS